MNYKKAFPKKFMKAGDIEIGDNLTVTIKKWSLEDVGRDEDKEQKLVLHFEETDQALACNTTNAEVIAGLYGPDTDDWIGQRITLWNNPNVKFGSKKVGGICVRDEKPTSTRGVRPQQATAGWTLDQALRAAEEVGMSKDELRQALTDAGFKGWNPSLTGWLQKLLAQMEPPPEPTDDAIEF